MVTDKQVRLLMKLINTENTRATAAAKAGMDPKTARRYLKLKKLPSQVAPIHDWPTRLDPFEDDHRNDADLHVRHGSLNPAQKARAI